MTVWEVAAPRTWVPAFAGTTVKVAAWGYFQRKGRMAALTPVLSHGERG